MANIVNNYSTTIVTIFADVIKKYEANLNIIKQCEEELNDLSHEAELSEPKDMYQGYLIYKAIRETRIRRRTAKNENELLKDTYDFFRSPAGQAFKSKIQSIQGDSVKLRAVQESRTYTPRQRNDLSCAGKHSDKNQEFEDMIAEFRKTKITHRKGKLRK